MTLALGAAPSPTLDAGAQELRDAHYQHIAVRCDNMFGVLFVIQWIACVAVAWFVSPYAWTGSEPNIHPHIWAAIIFGGIITSFPLFLILTRPGTKLTRHVVAAAQMLFSALLIHVSGGRIESHFHVFGSLAFLAFYRDWRVLLTATIVVAADHFLRGMFWPESVFGIATASHWRWLEHAGWVIFEDIFLVISCVQGQSEMDDIARRQEAANRANAAKSEFLARMSHEIRTPLNGVVGMIDLLRSTKMNEKQEQYAKLSGDAANTLLAVINDILDFSKIEAGKVDIENIEFDLHKQVEDLCELLSPVAAKKNLALASFVRPDVPHLLIGDPNRIRQVVTNLVGNGLKFTSSGAVTIRVLLDRQENEHAILRVQVQDTGIGIPRDRLDLLFKSFSQVDSSTTRKYGGTGLGLAISKRLVELMGGEIGIDSQEDKGTTFWFTLRLGVVAMSDPALDGIASALRGVRVLAVEPDSTLQRILKEQLDGFFSPRSQVVNPQEALDMLHQADTDEKPFAVALIPYGGDTGNALTTAIQFDAKLKKTKFIAVMDLNDRIDSQAILEAGFCAQLRRPFTQSRLLDVLTTVTINRPVKKKSSAVDKTAPPQSSIKGLHLLVAEDNEMNQLVTQEILKRAGCTCDIAADGALTLAAIHRRHYDAVLMDCQMPGMDGLEASRRIRQREKVERLPRVPIIALTAEAIEGDREKCLAAGMDGYVTKPINSAALLSTIHSLVPTRPAALNPAA